MQGAVLLIEAACMTPALVIALFQQDGDAWALGAASGICARGRAS